MWISGGKGTTHDLYIMALVCLLYFRTAQYNINACVMHIPGTHNNIADTLSHFQMTEVLPFCPSGKANS